MSFCNTIKKVFGFGDDSPEDEVLYSDTAEDTMPQSEHHAVARQPLTVADGELPDFTFDAVRRDAIFSYVVGEFNNALPDFLAKAVDPEVQRRILLEKLDKGIAEYMNNLAELARLHSESIWRDRQNQLTSQLEAVKQKSEDIERQAAEVKQKQLSADRQKRALTDRTHDLESQLARLESEREQFELENRSLVNRLKVASVVQEDVDKLRTENQQLRTELFHATHPGDSVTEHTGELILGPEEKSALEARIAELEKSLEENTRELADASKKLEEYRFIIDNLNKLESTLSAQEAKISAQSKAIDKRDKEIEALKSQIDEAKEKYETEEKRLRAEIAALRPPTVAERLEINFGEVHESEAPKISEDDLSALEASFENGEWFTNNPPMETPSMRPPEAEAEFGYRAPRRKSSPAANPNQLSLF